MPAMQLLIVDPEAYKPYSVGDLQNGGLGGTEATVIRLAEAMDAVVLQHKRSADVGRYRRMDSAQSPSHIIVLRDPLQAIRQAAAHPAATTLLWLHDLAGPGNPRGSTLTECGPALVRSRIKLVCVSDFQALEVSRNFLTLASHDRPTVIRIYNPVVVDSDAGSLPRYEPDKLVFFSSPHKGLEHTLYVFSYLHSRNPSLRLYLANPGYYADTADQPAGVINLGSMPHARILEHVRSSLCTFYPNYTYPETFGLVMAESNAVGTPVLAHPIGAAAEVLHGDGQIMPVPKARSAADRIVRRFPRLRPVADAVVRSSGALRGYEERINYWRSGGRPHVSARPEFALAAVVSEWQKALCSDGTQGTGLRSGGYLPCQ